MRIISGSARGRRLFAPTDGVRTIRPTTDRAREAVFNIIAAVVPGSRVLDLFAGTGAFGCEALSRGAATVYFVDLSKNARDLIYRNVSLIEEGPSRTTILCCDLRKSLGQLVHPVSVQPFDVIFADPPYGTKMLDDALRLIDQSPLITSSTIIVAEERKGTSPPQPFSRLTITDQRHYGDTMFFFYRNTQEQPYSIQQDERYETRAT